MKAKALGFCLFTHQKYLVAFAGARLQATLDPEGLMGRRLYQILVEVRHKHLCCALTRELSLPS